MRLLLAALTVLMLLSMAGCSGQETVSSNAALNTPTLTFLSSNIALPIESPTPDSLMTPQATMTASPAAIDTVPRIRSVTRTPASPAFVPAPTRTDDLPLPEDAVSTKNIPSNLRDFLNTQLKGQRRTGQPTGYLSSHPRGEVMAKYATDLRSQGWESIPLVSGMPDNTSLLIAQKDIRAIIAFMSENNGQTLVYIVTTLK